jgi:UDP-N-acetylglucosamine 1-carboxyvinyltransferase
MPRLKVIGGTPLHGEVAASGAKNAVLPLLAATLMMDGHSTLTNVPNLMDVNTMVKMLNALGVRAEYHRGHVKISNFKKVRHIAPYELVTAMRASFFVAGPLVAKTGYAKVPLPGGCSIGSRPIDIHLKGFERLGITNKIEHGFVELRAKKIIGAKVCLDFPSVGATENIMMAASLGEGTTRIENAAREPEVWDVGQFLIGAGARITGLGTSTIVIEGVPTLTGHEHATISDRVEAGTLLIAAAVTKGDITVTHVVPEHLEPLLQKLKSAGMEMTIGETSVRARYIGKLQAVDIETQPFPGFPTDMQAQMMALQILAEGTSVVKETIFENRFMHAHELLRMGANIRIHNGVAYVTGVEKLSGAEVKITDLRAGAALILAGLAAEGETVVHGLQHLRRGYDDFPGKLRTLGAHIIE